MADTDTSMSDQRTVVRNFFDSIAGIYTEAIHRDGHYMDDVAAFLAAQVRPGQRVLDLGCGNGHLTAKLPEDVEVVGLDVSPEMLVEAQRARPSGRYVQHDLHDPIPPELGRFDTILAVGCFEFCEQLTPVLEHLAAVMQPDARMFFTVGESHSRAAQGAREVPMAAKLVGGKFYLWPLVDTAKAIEGAQLVALRYQRTVGWKIPQTGAEMEYGQWVVRRSNPG